MASEAKDGGGLVFKPMDQFNVEALFGSGPIGVFTITNVTLWLALSIVAVICMMVLTTTKHSMVPSRGQSIAELAYGFVYKMVEDVTRQRWR